MPLILSEHDAARMDLAGAKKRRAARHARTARPDIPRAAASERTGLTTLLKAGWWYAYVVGRGYRLTHPNGGDSGWCETERAACAAARRQVTP